MLILSYIEVDEEGSGRDEGGDSEGTQSFLKGETLLKGRVESNV